MYPFSAAASGIAVVSLAIQLVDSVREIKRFLRNVSEAPKELKRLLDLLEQLELILENIGAQMARRQNNTGGLDTRTITSVQKAMKMCECNLLTLKKLVHRAKKISEVGNRASRTMGAFKLACKRKEIEEFENQLQQAINLLDLTMTINMNSVHTQSTDMILNELTLLKSPTCLTTMTSGPPETAKAADQRPYTRPAGSHISRRQSTNAFCYNTPLGRFIIRRKSQYTDFDDRKRGGVATSSETSWTFTPSFLNRCMVFRSTTIFGSIERSFRVWQVIPETHPVWEMCRKGNVVGVQSLLTSRAVSPFSVNDRGNTFLHHGAACSQIEVCELFLGLGFTGEEEDYYGRLPIQMVELASSTELQNADSTLRLLASKLSVTEIPLNNFFLAYIHQLKALRLALDIWITPQNVEKLQYALEDSVRSMWCDCGHSSLSPDSWNDWKFEIGRLIHVGAGIHSVYQYDDEDFISGEAKIITKTLLDGIMRIPCHTFDSNILLNEWIDTLRKAGLDVAEYLRVEIELHGGESPLSEVYYNSHIYEMKILTGEKEVILCDVFFDPSSPALDVLHEFRHFGINYFSCYSDDNWPYLLPKRDGFEYSVAELQRQRFERRAYKKAMKLAKIQGLLHKGPKMPGSWID